MNTQQYGTQSAAEERGNVIILDDLPAEQDALGFQPYIDTLAEIITSPKTRTPLTIGIFGAWGAGKTSLMRLVQQQIHTSCRTAWFDAWKYERETDLWRALLLHVLVTLREALPKEDESAIRELSDLEAALYRAVEREEMGGLQIDWGKLTGGLTQGALQIGLSFIPGASAFADMVKELQKKGAVTATEQLIDAIGRERSRLFIEQVRFLEQFQVRFRELVEKHILEKNLRLVVFVDDLDRCLPEKAVEVLEAIKLFLDVPGCIFVLGLDDKVVARGVEFKYHQLTRSGAEQQERLIEGARYLEKIIQLPFQLPPIAREKMADFITALVPDWADEECARVFAAGLVNNPRQVKRAVNTYLLLSALGEKTGVEIQPVLLSKLIALQSALPPLYDFLKDDNHRYLQILEAYFLAGQKPQAARESVKNAPDAPQLVTLPEVLEPFLRLRGIAAVRQVLTLHPDEPDYNFASLSPDQLRGYFTLARRAEAPEIAPQTAPPRADFEPELVPIPSGPFLMGSDPEKDQAASEEEQPQHKVNIPYDYWIGRYPVTNRQYQAFIQDSDHRPPSHWDGAQYPEGKGDHPVVSVSWRDAMAYCRWLSGKTGKHYTLPSEAEWEKAARGTRGYRYPWGDKWEAGRCNSEEAGVGDTTPVGQYSPQGDSPYGCADMSGNVWEWTRSLYRAYPYDPKDGREDLDADGWPLVRGGSWNSNRRDVRAAVRFRYGPYVFDDNYGFRVVLSPAERTQ